jgi:CDP-diacylglycerol--glycerol-3-phosphate 3-phosphatidyltransferase
MNLPNKLTISRFVMTAVLVACMAFGEEYEVVKVMHAPGRPQGWNFAYTASLFMFLAASITDYFDGEIARKRGLITSFGKLMDPLADKILMAGTFICLLPLKALPAWIVICIIGREFLITGLRLVAASKGAVLASEKLGKHKTVWQMITAGWFLLLLSLAEFVRAGFLPPGRWWEFGYRWVGLSLTAVALILTVLSGLGYLSKHRQVLIDEPM